MDTHRFNVRELSKEVRSFRERNRPFRIYHGDSHSFRAMHDPRAVIHTAHLDHILNINASSHFVMVEPNVTVERLVKETLKHGMIPLVVPSFPGITVGGTFAGIASSSSSFKHGFFDRAVLWIEAVLPDGTIARASRTRNSELLDGMVGSLGTLGIATLFQIKLVPALKWVELSYIPVQDMSSAMDKLDQLVQDPNNDFVESLIYGPEAQSYGIIAVGKLAATNHHPHVTFGGPNDEWFYEHALLAEERTESIPLMDYLFRHDRGFLGLGKCCFGRHLTNDWTRWAADNALKSDALIQTMQALHWADHLVAQDLVVPRDTTPKMLQYLEANMKVFPLLLSPVMQWPEEHTIMRPNPTQSSLALNISLRGWNPSIINSPAAFRDTHHQMEQLLHRLGGFKWLYSRNYYTEEEFWQVYSKEPYEQLRDKFNAQYLQTAWKKSEAPERKPIQPKPKGFWDRVFAKTGVVAMRHAQDRV